MEYGVVRGRWPRMISIGSGYDKIPPALDEHEMIRMDWKSVYVLFSSFTIFIVAYPDRVRMINPNTRWHCHHLNLHTRESTDWTGGCGKPLHPERQHAE
ncbi:hypothetical protein C8Q80DRAFT_571355 [Daedaleopsis nitida]|nr:hypothetical protein C8Q80DRAFT_571355 [Daedaleopsis nitida]